MPFVTETPRSLPPKAEFLPRTSFSEAFGTALGVVIDEELSISTHLNRDGWRQRRQIAEELGIERETRVNQRGQRQPVPYDWERLSREHEEIKSDAQLNAERNADLAARRRYAEDVLSRAPISAQFLGAANGYLLDPVSIVTAPISLPVRGAQGIHIATRIAQAGGRAAAVEGATELAIQPFVFDHKREIGAEYDAQDAITAIATAAAGGAALGGAVDGIAGYLRGARKSVEGVELSKSDQTAVREVQRMEDLLEDVPPEAQERTLREAQRHLDSYEQPAPLREGSVVDQSEVPAEEVIPRQSEVPSSAARADGSSSHYPVQSDPGPAPKLRKRFFDGALMVDTTPIGGTLYRETSGDGLSRILLGTLSNNQEGGLSDDFFVSNNIDLAIGQGSNKGAVIEFDGDLVSGRKNKKPGIISDDQGAEFVSNFVGNGSINKVTVSPDVKITKLAKNFLAKEFTREALPDGSIVFTKKAKANAGPNAIPNDAPARDIIDKEYVPPPVKKTATQSEILERLGLSEGYNESISQYEKLSVKKISDGEDLVDAEELIDVIDREISGLESVVGCVRG